MTKVALSGASGQLGRFLRPALLDRGVDLRSAGGRSALEPLRPGEDVMHGDLRDPAIVDRLLDGVDVLIHMAGTSVERPLPEIIENNLVGLQRGLRRRAPPPGEADRVRQLEPRDRDARCRHASSSSTAIFGPDGFYGLSKMWGEGMGRLYWDKHGIETVSVRIGSAIERPTEFRHLSTWFGLDDLLSFTMRCIEAPNVGYAVVWGVSNNTRSYWTPTGLRGAGLAAGAECRGLRCGDPGQGEPDFRDRPPLSRRQLRRHRLSRRRTGAPAAAQGRQHHASA